MSAQVYSPQWYRVAALRPRLAPQVRVRRQITRGECWMVLADELTGRSVRLNRQAYELAGRMNGERSLEQLWAGVQQQGSDPPTQDEVLDVLLTLQDASLLEMEAAASGALAGARALQAAAPDAQAASHRRAGFNPLAWRLPLGHPGRVLDALHAFQARCFTPAAALVWALMVALLMGLGAWHGAALWAFGQTWLGTPRFLGLALLLYPPIKGVHELAHGLAVRRWGGRVREAGVTLMLGMPVPYVDASASAAFAQARQRIVVSAAGIGAELAIAACSLLAWVVLDEGWARDVAYAALVITTVSTLAFNGNPLQRLDGYYVLCDLLGLPNLATRSRSWWLQALRQRLLAESAELPMPLARGERKWLFAYAPLAWAWTLVLSALSVAWLSRISWVLGGVAAAVLLASVVLRPALQLFSALARSAQAQDRAARRWRRWRLALGVVALAALALPLPHRLVAQGVVWPDDQAQLRAASGGMVTAVLHGDGESVPAGTPVLSLHNPDLAASSALADARVRALEAEALQAQAQSGGAVGERAGNVRTQLAAAQDEAAQWAARLEATGVRALATGRLALPPSADLEGHYLKEGSLIGQVLTGAPPRVRVAVPQDRVRELQAPGAEAVRVSVRLADDASRVHPGRVLQDSEGAVPQLPSAALAERHGGDWPTDPADADALRPLKPVVLVDVGLVPEGPAEVPGAQPSRLGTRAWVCFDLGWSPLAWQGAQALRRGWLRQLSPTR